MKKKIKIEKLFFAFLFVRVYTIYVPPGFVIGDQSVIY